MDQENHIHWNFLTSGTKAVKIIQLLALLLLFASFLIAVRMYNRQKTDDANLDEGWTIKKKFRSFVDYLNEKRKGKSNSDEQKSTSYDE